MATFEVKVYPAVISPHPDGDAIEICEIAGYRSIVRKGEIKTGDPAAYIPEGSILPDTLIAAMGLENKLGGPGRNRVSPVRLRGIYSEGLVFPMPNAAIGADVTKRLGIVKYEPPIPDELQGEVDHRPGQLLRFDIDNIKTYPGVLQPGEQVVVTEKLNGTWMCAGYYRDEPMVIASKGNSHDQLSFRVSEANAHNPYVTQALLIKPMLDRLHREYDSVYILGELYGLHRSYRYDAGREWRMRVFDIHLGEPMRGDYASWDRMTELLQDQLPTVPLLYRGPYDPDAVRELAAGPSTLNAKHRREGVVVKADPSRNDLSAGRAIFKVVNEAHGLKSRDDEIQ